MNLHADPGLTVRTATPPDADAVRRLAALDGRPEPTGRALVAERHGVAIAALSLWLTSGQTVADRFTYTEQAVRLVRRRRYELLRQGGDVAPALTLLAALGPEAPMPRRKTC